MAHAHLRIAVLALLLATGVGAQAGGRRQLRDAFCTPEQEADFLLTFKSSRNYDPTGVLSTWSAARDMCTTWDGIVCSDTGHVTILDVRKQGLDGPLPNGFSCFGQLEQMTLGGNDFIGTLPVAWATMPALTRIRLKNSDLVGMLPPEWAALEDIRVITLSNNGISGSLPEEWEALQVIKTLDIKNNELVGTIPASYGDLPELQEVNLQNNMLEGEVPFDQEEADIVFLPQNPVAPVPTEAPSKDCVYENEDWSILPRPDVPAPGYDAEYLGLVQCFVLCPNTDIIVWNEGTQMCQCWSATKGFFAYTGPVMGDTAFVLSFCSDPASGSALSLAPSIPDFLDAQTRSAPIPAYDIADFLSALISIQG